MALLATTALASPAAAQGFNQFVGFGDSTMDSGYFLYNSTGGMQNGTSELAANAAIRGAATQGGTGTFTGPGVMNTTMLAARFGLTALPIGYPGGGGSNYANGSAQTVYTTQQSQYSAGLFDNVPTVAQIDTYLASTNDHANPHALFMVSTGANDLFWMQTQSMTSDQLYQAFMLPWANDLAGTLGALQGAGARSILVLDLNEYARLVAADGSVSASNQTIIDEAARYSATIWSSLASAGVNFIPVDINSLFTYVVQHPAAFGFQGTNALGSNPACNMSLVPSGIICTTATLVSPDAELTHLWADPEHLTTAGQAIETDFIYSLLTAPYQVSLLAESAVQGGLARVAAIQGQIETSAVHRGPNGVNVWVNAGASSQSFRNQAADPGGNGIPFSGTVGADYLAPGGVVLGLAVTAGEQDQHLSAGGHFNQVDEALSLYAAYRTGPFWGNAVASYGLYQTQISRQVPLGIFTDQNNGNTNGEAVALALRGGGDIRLGPVTTGPVAGLVMQHVRIDGFTETGTSGVTALSFGGQTRDSVVSQIGWRGAVDLGAFQPFAELAWDHEWDHKARSITTSLTSIAAPSYVTSIAPAASDWAFASIGSAYSLSSQVTLRATLWTQFVNPQVASYGGNIGLNVSF